MTSDAERTAIDRLTQRLSARFPLLEAAVVARVVRAGTTGSTITRPGTW